MDRSAYALSIWTLLAAAWLAAAVTYCRAHAFAPTTALAGEGAVLGAHPPAEGAVSITLHEDHLLIGLAVLAAVIAPALIF